MVGPALDDGRPFFPPIYAPYKCATVPYDGLGFADFPDRSGWAILDRPKDPSDPMREAFLLRREKYSDSSALEITDCGVDEKAAFVQAWLFFGALTEVLETAGVTLQVDDFLAQLNGSTIVSTSRLHSYGQLWALGEDKLGADGRVRRARKVYDIIREGEFFLSRWAPEGYDDCENGVELGSSENKPDVAAWSEQRRSIHQVYFSVAVVFLFLRLSTSRIFPDDFPRMRLLVPDFGEYLFGWAYRRADDSLINDFTIPKGQCPSETQMLHETLFGPAKIFLCYLQRDALQQDHHRCTRNQCKVADMPDGAYQTRHTSPDCHCSTILLDGAELAHSLRIGKTPLIQIEFEVQPGGSFDERVTLEIVHDEPYVAISHVWSHGLGNKFQNGLPECQLRRLKNYVVTLSATLGLDRVPHIWIDTLCIPVNEEFRDERRTAIELLPQTFDKAQHVLVLDEELYSVSLSETSMMEIGLRILCSTWMRRVWTLAEGVQAVRFGAKRSLRGHLAKVTYETTRLSFQLLEGCISYSCLSQISRNSQLGHDHDYYCCHLLWDALETRLPSFVLSDDLPHLSHRLQEVSAALKFRKTTRITDEPVCIALLLGLPTLSITGVKTAAERMRELYILVREFPRTIIFRTFDPRQPYGMPTPECLIVDTEEKKDKAGIPVDGKDLAYSALVKFSTNLDELPGFRWAPRSFLSDFPGIGGHVRGPKPATCDANGLHGEYPGFIFDIDQSDRNNKTSESSCTSPSLATVLSFSNLVLAQPRPDSGGDYWGQWVRFKWKKLGSIGDILGTSMPSSVSSPLSRPLQLRAAIIFDEIGQLNDNAILGYVLADDESCPATPSSMSRSHAKITQMSIKTPPEEQELKLHPLAKGYVVKVGSRSDPQLASWYDSQFQPSLEIHGQRVSWRQKWCIV